MPLVIVPDQNSFANIIGIQLSVGRLRCFFIKSGDKIGDLRLKSSKS